MVNEKETKWQGEKWNETEEEKKCECLAKDEKTVKRHQANNENKSRSNHSVTIHNKSKAKQSKFYTSSQAMLFLVWLTHDRSLCLQLRFEFAHEHQLNSHRNRLLFSLCFASGYFTLFTLCNSIRAKCILLSDFCSLFRVLRFVFKFVLFLTVDSNFARSSNDSIRFEIIVIVCVCLFFISSSKRPINIC